ncbi:MAG: membrane protein insertase YidC, partial [Candidatus Cloacimonetes bacterium]|nr:membrane protein insertase YidC [Candidatus Cloacimonadota bacterium]
RDKAEGGPQGNERHREGTSAQAQIVKLSNSNMTVSFNTKGASIAGIELNKFSMKNGTRVQLVPKDAQLSAMRLIHPASETQLANVVYQHSFSADSTSVVFYLGSLENPIIQRRFTLDDQYGINLDIAVNAYKSMNGVELDFGAGIADTEKVNKSKAQDYKFQLYADNQVQKLTLAKLKKNPAWGAFSSFSWIALRSKYFAIVLQEKEPNLMRNFSTGINPDTGNPFFKIDSKQSSTKQSWNQTFTIYAGPSDFSILKNYGKQMENIPERGVSWLRWLTVAFAWLLNFLHGYIHNYGVVLILFAFIMKILFHPLTHRQMEHGLKQQKLQPELVKIQKMYPKDLVKQREETKKLYKEHNTSMAAGCLPVLIQMPIIIPLYSFLRYSLDMRNANFVFWVKDLSEPDPYLVLPIIMAAFSLLQSLMMRPPKMDESQMDDQEKMRQSQMKMMTWGMPLMMFFIFKSMPAGLVLYWTTFSIFSVIHQYYLNKHFKNKEN